MFGRDVVHAVQAPDGVLLEIEDDEIFEVCREAVDKDKSWPWASKVIQARKDDAAKVQQSAVSARSTMFKGGI